MNAADGKGPIFPEAVGRVVSLICPCGWEASYVFPEECALFMVRILEHLRDNHELKLPPMKMQNH